MSIAALLTFARAHWRAILILLVLGVIAAAAYSQGYKRAALGYEAKLQAMNAAHSQALAQAQAEAREQERSAAVRIAAINETHHKDLTHAKAAHDRTIADLRSGAFRLRERFNCFPAPGGRAAALGPLAPVDAGGSPGGLRPEDAEFLIGESARADEVAIELQGCKAIARADRGLP